MLGKVNLEPSFASDVVIACSVLHNICQERNEPIQEVHDPYTEEDNQGLETRQSSDEIRQKLLNYVVHQN